MDIFLTVNWIAFTAIVIYGVYLFAKVVATRVSYIKLGKKSEFDRDFKERFRRVGKIVLASRNY